MRRAIKACYLHFSTRHRSVNEAAERADLPFINRSREGAPYCDIGNIFNLDSNDVQQTFVIPLFPTGQSTVEFNLGQVYLGQSLWWCDATDDRWTHSGKPQREFVNARHPIQYNPRDETTWTRFQIEGWFLIVPRPQCAFIWKSTRYKWVENNVFLCIGGRPKCSLKPNSRYIRARYTRICSHTNVHKLIGTLEMCSLWLSCRYNRARYNGSRLYYSFILVVSQGFTESEPNLYTSMTMEATSMV